MTTILDHLVVDKQRYELITLETGIQALLNHPELNGWTYTVEYGLPDAKMVVFEPGWMPVHQALDKLAAYYNAVVSIQADKRCVIVTSNPSTSSLTSLRIEGIVIPHEWIEQAQKRWKDESKDQEQPKP